MATKSKRNGKAKATQPKATKPQPNGTAKATKRLSADAVITVLVKTNPRREGHGTHKRFAVYKTGMTVGEYLDKGKSLGAKRSNLRWDVKRGHIDVRPKG